MGLQRVRPGVRPSRKDTDHVHRRSASDFGSGEVLGPRSSQDGDPAQGTEARQVLPNADGSQAVCLWEGEQADVKAFVEGAVGHVSKNQDLTVDATKAVGLP